MPDAPHPVDAAPETSPAASRGGKGRRIALQVLGRTELFNASPVGPARLMTITDMPPTSRLISDAVVTRMTLDRPQWRAERGAPALRTGAVYDGDGIEVPVHAIDARDRSRRLIVRADEPVLSHDRRRAARFIPGRHLYAGELKPHFGHFLLESLCRAWAFTDRPAESKLIFHGGKADPPDAISPIMRALLEPFGIGPDDIVIANHDLRVEELIVPTSQYDLGVRADRGFAGVFASIRRHHRHPPGDPLPERVYFSRRLVDAAKRDELGRTARGERATRWALGKIVANEHEVERMFAARGFAVVMPERLPVPHQIALAANARWLAGVTGTALHHALFATHADARIISVATRLSANQIAIEQLKGLRSAHIFCARPRHEDQATTVDLDLLCRELTTLGL